MKSLSRFDAGAGRCRKLCISRKTFPLRHFRGVDCRKRFRNSDSCKTDKHLSYRRHLQSSFGDGIVTFAIGQVDVPSMVTCIWLARMMMTGPSYRNIGRVVVELAPLAVSLELFDVGMARSCLVKTRQCRPRPEISKENFVLGALRLDLLHRRLKSPWQGVLARIHFSRSLFGLSARPGSFALDAGVEACDFAPAIRYVHSQVNGASVLLSCIYQRPGGCLLKKPGFLALNFAAFRRIYTMVDWATGVIFGR